MGHAQPMPDPVVLTDEQVDAELTRLCADLRAARVHSGLSARSAAANAGLNPATLWRVENAHTRPTLLVFTNLSLMLGVHPEIDDGNPAPRRPMSARWRLPPGYRLRPAVVEAGWDPLKRFWRGVFHLRRVRLGAELWWARRQELTVPLDARAACRRLGVSHHALSAVEHGPSWPDLATVVRVAGLTGRRIVLTSDEDGERVPPWDRDTPVSGPSPP